MPRLLLAALRRSVLGDRVYLLSSFYACSRCVCQVLRAGVVRWLGRLTQGWPSCLEEAACTDAVAEHAGLAGGKLMHALVF